MVYDTSLRVGAYLGLTPRFVYLHAGARAGAKALGLNAGTKKLAMSDLPHELQVLAPEEVEDFLCIYKKTMARIGQAA